MAKRTPTAHSLKGDLCMTDRITKKAKIEALLQAGKAPREIAEILGLNRRYAVDIALAHAQSRARESHQARWRAAPEGRPGVAQERA